MKRRILLATVGCLIVLGTGETSMAAGPVGWRTDWTGRYPQARPPTEWAKDKNVLWMTPMPAWSNSSVVLSGDRILVCAEPCTLVCVDARDGRILWQGSNTYFDVLSPDEVAKAKELLAQAEPVRKQLAEKEKEQREVKKSLDKTPDDAALKDRQAELAKQVGELKKQLEPSDVYTMPPTHGENGYSSGTPVTDGRHGWALFGNGVAACYDFDGRRKWARIVERPTQGWGQSSSPLLVGQTLLILINQLHALDAATGELLWQAPAPQRWGSPAHVRVGNTDLAVTPSGDIIRVADGKVLAKQVSDVTYGTPLVEGDTIYFIQAGGKAVKLKPAEEGTLQTEVLWETKPADDRYYSSPLLHDGLIYAVNRANVFSVIDASTGAVVHERKLDLGNNSQVYSSVTLAGKLMYVSGENGVTLVFEPGRDPKQVARNELERFRSSPVFVGPRLYVRTRDRLYCLGQP